MKKLLVLYMLLLFTACTENGSLHQSRKTVHKSAVVKSGEQQPTAATPGLAISVIVNREIALHESAPERPTDETTDEHTQVPPTPF